MAADMIDINTLTIHSSPNVKTWASTVRIRGIEWRPGPAEGLRFRCEGLERWPDYVPPGWDGPIQYTVWIVVPVAGRWHTAGIIQMWRRNASNRSPKDNGWTGAPPLRYYRDWVYEPRWGEMLHYTPRVGDRIGFFLTAGNARKGSAGQEPDVTSVAERSNIVMVTVPSNDNADVVFSGDPQPEPEPEPQPDPQPEPEPKPYELERVLAQLSDQRATLDRIEKKLIGLSEQLALFAARPDPTYDARWVGPIVPRPRE